MKTAVKKRSRRKPAYSEFWRHVLHHRSLRRQPMLAKLLAGCELIVALDGDDVLWQ